MKTARNYDDTRVQKHGGVRTRNFICVVDAYRRPERRHSTAGRYRVGARDAKSAKKLLQAQIGFGSIMVLCEDSAGNLGDVIAMRECVREIYNTPTGRFITSPEPVRHACAKRA